MKDAGTPGPDLRSRTSAGVLLFEVRVKPRASRTAVVGLRDGAIEVRVAAPPVDDAANSELTRFLAKQLGVARGAVRVHRGEKSRTKTLAVGGMEADELLATLGLP